MGLFKKAQPKKMPHKVYEESIQNTMEYLNRERDKNECNHEYIIVKTADWILINPIMNNRWEADLCKRNDLNLNPSVRVCYKCGHVVDEIIEAINEIDERWESEYFKREMANKFYEEYLEYKKQGKKE